MDMMCSWLPCHSAVSWTGCSISCSFIRCQIDVVSRLNWFVMVWSVNSLKFTLYSCSHLDYKWQ